MVGPLRNPEPLPGFSKALSLLEDQEVALLLAGEVDDAAMQTMVRRMGGDPREDRYRVLALLADNDPAAYLPQGVTPGEEAVRVLQYPTGRSPAASSEPSAVSDPFDDPGGLLEVIHEDLSRVVNNLTQSSSVKAARTSGTFRPGELRVAVDSLQPLIDAHGVNRVLQWLRKKPIPLMREPRFNGRSHWVYYGPSDDHHVETLMADPGLFDVLVRVRRRQQLVEHQWELRPDRFPHLTSRLESPWMIANP